MKPGEIITKRNNDVLLNEDQKSIENEKNHTNNVFFN